jgi:acetoacetyl-CoA synthetase
MWTQSDLIEFDADGQARIHGRSDSVLQVDGVRIGPAEIYRALSDVDEVSEAMAVELRAQDRTARIVLLVVLHQRGSLDARLVVRIRREIARNATPAHVPELVAEVDELPSTHSGKRSERAARDIVNGRPVANAQALHNPGSLSQIAQAVRAATARRQELTMAPECDLSRTTEARVRAIWESILGLILEPDDNFFELGGTSLAAVRVLLAIHEQLGVELAPSVFIHAQTTATMAAVIDGPEDARAPTFVLMRAGTGERPTFIAHDVSGGVLALLPLATRLQTDRPVYGLQARGLDSRHEPQTRVEEMADSCVQAIRTVQPLGPYTLIGYSFGGLVALEIARRLTALGAQVDLLAMIDAHLDHRCLPRRQRRRFLIGRPIGYLRLALASPRRRLPGYARNVVLRALTAVDIDPPGAALSLPPRLRQVERAGWEALRAYRPRPYDGDATLLVADVSPRYPDQAEIWPRVVRGRVDVERFEGGHFDVVSEPHLEALAARLSELIAAPIRV